MNIELSTKAGLPLNALQMIEDLFKKHGKIEAAILYGSRVLERYKKGSDIDICLMGADISLIELFEIETQLDDLMLPWKIDLCLYNHIDNSSFIEHIKSYGIKIYPL